MSNKRSYQKQLRVQMNYVPAPDVRERLSRVLSILLKAATRHTATLGGSMNAKKTATLSSSYARCFGRWRGQ